MTRMLRSLMALALAVLGLSLLGPAPSAFACSCSTSALKPAVNGADVIFRATVVDALATPDAQTTYTLHAKELYKGEVGYATQVVAPTEPAECGLENVIVGKEYVFFALGEASPHRSGLCSGTGPANVERISRIERLLKTEGTTVEVPPPPDPVLTKVEAAEPKGFTRLAAPGGAIVVVGLLGLLIAGRLARR